MEVVVGLTVDLKLGQNLVKRIVNRLLCISIQMSHDQMWCGTQFDDVLLWHKCDV